ncbi:hypothetical protein [Crocosphaera subtropica]|uniref:hypothetical protein n=1 Tax=Crocosphaera subtropica TaxID=2546360 RepID=UPI0002D980D3|nr:hypothetical protein [Crocosphaera subtropica]
MVNVSASNAPQINLEAEIQGLAHSDVKDNIPRRTDFVIELYHDNSQHLTPPEIRKIYDEAYSQQVRKKRIVRKFVGSAIAILIIVLSILAIAIWLSDKTGVPTLKRVSVNLPFGIGCIELEINRVEQIVAWSLYVELVTRIAIQPLKSDEGLLKEALTSLHSLFDTTRQILKEAGPVVGVSPQSVGGIAIAVLNQGIRPFLAKWHPALEDWESKCLSTTSNKQHEKNWDQEPQLRHELELLRHHLKQYADALAKIADVTF